MRSARAAESSGTAETTIVRMPGRMVAPDSVSTISAWVSSVAGSSGWTHGGLCEKTAMAARAEPHQGHNETAREQDADGLDGGEPPPGRDPRLAHALGLAGVVAAERLLAADATQDAQPADDVGRHRRQLGVARALDALPPLHGSEQGHAEQDEQRRRREHEDPHAHRRAEHDGGHDEVGRELGDRACRDLHERTELVAVAARDREHLAGRRASGQDVAELERLAGDELGRAVEGDEPLAHDDGVEGDAARGAEDGDAGERQDPAGGRGGVARDDAGVDGPADHPGPDRLRHHPDERDEQTGPEQAAVLPHHPPEEGPRRAGVGRVGAAVGVGPDVGRKVSHGLSTLGPGSDSAPPIFSPFAQGDAGARELPVRAQLASAGTQPAAEPTRRRPARSPAPQLASMCWAAGYMTCVLPRAWSSPTAWPSSCMSSRPRVPCQPYRLPQPKPPARVGKLVDRSTYALSIVAYSLPSVAP